MGNKQRTEKQQKSKEKKGETNKHSGSQQELLVGEATVSPTALIIQVAPG